MKRAIGLFLFAVIMLVVTNCGNGRFIEQEGVPTTTTIETDDGGVKVRIPGTYIDTEGDFCIPINGLFCIEP